MESIDKGSKKKLNIGTTIIGLIFIGVVVSIWIIAIAEFKWNAGGGLIIALPLFWIIKTIWNELVLQKVKPRPAPKPKQSTPIKTADPNTNSENDPTENNKTKLQNETYASANINSNNSSTKSTWIKQAINFLTFDTPTFLSVLDEGQRRMVLLLSFIIPFLVSYLMLKEWQAGHIEYDEDFIGYYLISYLMFFVILLIYIWIREGNGNVKPGGNAMNALKKLILILCIILGVIGGFAFLLEVYNNHIRENEEKVMGNDLLFENLIIYKEEDINSSNFPGVPGYKIPTEKDIKKGTGWYKYMYEDGNELEDGYLPYQMDIDFNNDGLMDKACILINEEDKDEGKVCIYIKLSDDRFRKYEIDEEFSFPTRIIILFVPEGDYMCEWKGSVNNINGRKYLWNNGICISKYESSFSMIIEFDKVKKRFIYGWGCHL